MSEAEFQALTKLEDAIQDFINEGDVEAARVAFNFFDINHDNRVSKDEVFQILNKLQGDYDPEVDQGGLEDLYKASDVDADGTLDFEEFQNFLRRTSNS
jgi:Ca2+-binding EF-hand superfamily protein